MGAARCPRGLRGRPRPSRPSGLSWWRGPVGRLRSSGEGPRTSMILVSADGLGRQFDRDPVFNHLRFEVRAGERIGLVGPHGAGKTTLMRLLAGLDPPDYGRLYVRPGIRVSLLRQEPDFAPDQTLMEVARSG